MLKALLSRANLVGPRLDRFPDPRATYILHSLPCNKVLLDVRELLDFWSCHESLAKYGDDVRVNVGEDDTTRNRF